MILAESPLRVGFARNFPVHPIRLCFFLALVAVILSLSGTGDLATPSVPFRYDKIAHFFVFGLIATALFRALRPTGWLKSFPARAVLTVAVVSALGGLDELRQLHTEGRFAEWGDWIADTLGAIVAVAAYRWLPLYRQILETRPHELFAKRHRSC